MDTTFAELGLNEQILEGVAALGFATPTPVQRESIPQILAGRDVVASAQTGTGKTAAFALPILQVIADTSRRARLEREGERGAGDTPPSGASPAPDDIAADPTPAGTDEDGPTVLADAVKGPGSVSIRVDDEGRPVRRRRRHHRRRATASDGETSEGTPRPQRTADAANPAEKAPSRPADRRKARRRRSSSRKGAPSRDVCAADPNAQPFGPFALVVTPTRELASQIERVVSVVCEKTGQKAVVVMGGTKFDRQIRELEAGCDLLVATPGRLIDLFEHQHVRLDEVRCLVLDEADRMLDMGFWPSVRRIVAACPRERQTLLFSATIPPSIKGTVDAMLNDPVRIEIARVGETADTVDEHLCCVTQGQKLPLLEALVARGGASGQVPERVLVFCRTKMRADMLETQLKANGRRVGVMHADRPQRARERALSEFRSGKLQVLVATDVMSRGIDVSGIDAVVNFDVPMDPEDYVHRIGRTGRAGATGHAYTFVAPDEISPLREIEYFTKKLVPLWDLEGFSYDEGRILPNPARSTEKPTRRLFSGSRGRSRGGRYGRHY